MNCFTRKTRKPAKNAKRRFVLEEFLSKRTLAAFFEVYRQVGYGFPEAICANGLAVEFEFRGLPFKREVPIEVVYKGVSIGFFRIDFVVGDRILVETKASKELTAADQRQVLNYLKASSFKVGLLLHFGPEKGTFKRFVHSRKQ
jgi:GxxExxY protein